MGNVRSINQPEVRRWAWAMEDTAAYTVDGPRAYVGDCLSLVLFAEEEHDLFIEDLNADTLACINAAARSITEGVDYVSATRASLTMAYKVDMEASRG